MELQIKGYGGDVKRGRPKGPSSGTKALRKQSKEKQEELLHPKLGVVKTTYRVKFRAHKNPWEEEKLFRDEFLRGEFKVTKSWVLAPEGYLIKSFDWDATYQPF
jgi:hypothetical protein